MCDRHAESPGPIAPGDSKTYTFQCTQHGTSWYHSHHSSQYGMGEHSVIQSSQLTSRRPRANRHQWTVQPRLRCRPQRIPSKRLDLWLICGRRRVAIQRRDLSGVAERKWASARRRYSGQWVEQVRRRRGLCSSHGAAGEEASSEAHQHFGQQFHPGGSNVPQLSDMSDV